MQKDIKGKKIAKDLKLKYDFHVKIIIGIKNKRNRCHVRLQ